MLEIGSLVDGKYKILRKSEKMEYRILKWSNKILS